ncbi:hypothetical protein UFOVP184_9 [uncultured Caudovirales phage]|uniref:Uncharacterized protein n=1 Tax=uncultured Caudovirales phage TaxID=2100421 RepID=A0A6J7WCC0_9CAUD|nr:hypothetical protein UFOVP184_9 [uncultured Caudovirales phage]
MSNLDAANAKLQASMVTLQAKVYQQAAYLQSVQAVANSDGTAGGIVNG